MFSLALKNAILMVLIILIVHFLLVNFLNRRRGSASSSSNYWRPAIDTAMSTQFGQFGQFGQTFQESPLVQNFTQDSAQTQAPMQFMRGGNGGSTGTNHDYQKDEEDLYKFILNNKSLNPLQMQNQNQPVSTIPSASASASASAIGSHGSLLGTFSKESFAPYNS